MNSTKTEVFVMKEQYEAMKVEFVEFDDDVVTGSDPSSDGTGEYKDNCGCQTMDDGFKFAN